MQKRLTVLALLLCAGVPAGAQLQLPLVTINRGDIIVTIEQGPVMWFLPNGTPRGVLVSLIPGTGEGLDFDPSGRLYVTRWCVDPFYVAQSGCSGDILRFAPGMLQPAAFDVALENSGSWWLDIAADGCTVYYTSVGPNVKRYDTCRRAQLPDFNAAPLPGGVTHDVRVLPDRGVLVSSGAVVARLDASGALVQTYAVPGEPALWAGLDVMADGTFWAVNYETSNIHRFDLASGVVRQSFNTGTPAHTAVAVRVRK
jgi:hypothetical protein